MDLYRRQKILLLLAKLKTNPLSLEVQAFINRVTADGGTVVSPKCIGTLDADVVMYPSGGKVGKLYSQVGTDGIDDFNVSRNSSKWVVNKDGLLEEVLPNVPAFDYSDGSCPSLLLEPQSTNLYLNSELNNVENTTVTATPYTVFLYGTGTITFSGAYVGTLVGIGVNDKVEITFTPSAGTLTSTDSGSVDKKQLENLGYSTSYIPTSGTTVTRLADVVNNSGDVNSFNSEEGVLYVEMSALVDKVGYRIITLFDGTNSNYVHIKYQHNFSEVYGRVTVGGVAIFVGGLIIDQTTSIKVAVKWKLNDFSFWINGVEIAYNNSGAVFSINTLNTITMTDENGYINMYAKVKALKVFKTANVDLEALTLTGYSSFSEMATTLNYT